MIVYLAVVILLLIPGVQATKPLPDFSANVTSGNAPLTVSFTDLSSNNPTGWAWYFGDENYSVPWTEVTPDSGYPARTTQNTVVMPDGSIILMGGYNGTNWLNDVWRSTDYGKTWTLMNASAGWLPRNGFTSVAMPDNSIVLMGGTSGNYPNMSLYNDVWRSTDEGATWTEMTPHAAWTGRNSPSSVVMPDGSIILTGGSDGWFVFENDVWRSTDEGATWTRVTADGGWVPRCGHTTVVTPDGSIVLMGGYEDMRFTNDVWRSADSGKTWQQMNANPGWSARNGQTTAVMPDGSILLMGGNDDVDFVPSLSNDVWRSTDDGATWTEITPHAQWSARSGQSGVLMPDGSLVLMGGNNDGYGASDLKDVWQFQPAGSTEQNPVHTYIKPGSYPVSLQVYNNDGFISVQKAGYITVLAPNAESGNITVSSTPSGAEIFLDNTDTGNVTPYTISNVPVGSHSVYVTLSGYKIPLPVSVTVSAGSTTPADFTLVQIPPKPVPDFSTDITSGKAPLTVSFTDLSSNNPTGWAWYFGDENFSGQWTQMTPHAAWAGRSGQSVVAMPDGNIVLTGGSKGFPQSFNDAWQSGDNGATWSLVNASPWSLGKIGHSSVVLPDASIVTMSGDSGNGWFSDVWRSVDKGVTWTQLTHDAPWGARIAFPSVAMPDGSIVLMGGFGGSFTYPDDVWKSTDEGSTWTQLTAHAGWSPRAGHTAVVMPDGNIVVMGGNNINSHVVFNDVWRSSDGGKTWTQVNASAGWAPRGSLSSVVMPDGSILLTGGDDLNGHYYNDVWRSTDEGSTWARVNPHAGWSARSSLSAVAMPDGSFIIMAGSGPTVENDVWGLETAGSSAQNPVHTYTKPGTYQVSLQAYNSGGFGSIRKTEYITVLAPDTGTLFVNSTPSGA